MDKDKKNALCVLIGIVVFAVFFTLVGFMAAKLKYDKPIKETIERDTVTKWETIPQYFPQPVDGTEVKTVYKWLTRVDTDTIVKTDVITCHDSVLVEVPITSKHYSNEQYDAYISGYEPNLDSIFVHQKTEYITETITRHKPPNKWELDVVGGIDYNTAKKSYDPYAMGELLYKPSRVQFGIQGGVIKADKVEPFIGGKVKIRVF